ncbi:MAG TPA: NAD(P)/FAD-dependent oxidoreductase, partial [bacterium (Candidatus Stahlbacteria)]|nr:NAD(P)/FAD-dependent oxidoreductase [Candidatus Stahlbacteria bacterium]
IAIVGAGDVAFDYALSLSIRNKVFILNRGEEVKCLPTLFREVSSRRSIHYLDQTQVEKVRRDSKGLILTVRKDVEIEKLRIDYLIFAIGREPNLEFLSRSVIEELEILKRQLRLFMIGDVKNGPYRQVTIAAGDGTRTAMEIYHSIYKGDK